MICYSGNRNCPDVSGNSRSSRSRSTLDGLSRPQAKDQINLTDEDSRIMPVAGGGFEQCYNAQAVVSTESLLVIAFWETGRYSSRRPG